MSGINTESKKRPVVVTVFGILIIIQGTLLLLCCIPLGLIGMQVSDLAAVYPENYKPFFYGTMVISLVEVIYGLLAAIGLLMNKTWARLHVVIWAGLSAITNLIYLVVDYGYFGVKWRLENEGGSVEFVVGILLYIAFFIFYGLIIFFMSRPNVEEYYGR